MRNSKRIGRCVDYTATEDVMGGDLVAFPGFVGVASTDIPAGESGACEVEGVFELPKVAGAIAQGTVLYLNGAAVTAVKPASGEGFVGVAWEDAAAAATTVEARINFGSAPVPDPPPPSD
jgi:predicted RecA/RadA family phage recombinase